MTHKGSNIIDTLAFPLNQVNSFPNLLNILLRCLSLIYQSVLSNVSNKMHTHHTYYNIEGAIGIY